MSTGLTAVELLEHEARALLTRLDTVRPLALQETMVAAAAPPVAAHVAIEKFLGNRRRALREQVKQFIRRLNSSSIGSRSAEEVQRVFTLIRLRFNAFLSQFDLFSDALTQRSERETGVWLAGLDVVAGEALALPGYYVAPPVMCYLDRGPGAAIRRARTRLPGGGENPIAVIRVPRERMVGSGVASSLVHEVGHQAAALLDLVPSLRQVIRAFWRKRGPEEPSWRLWDRWISEIVADFWGVAKVGAAATLGLMAIVSLPAPFVFRIDPQDPHPAPWIRMKVSCAIGDVLYPHPQWKRLANFWEALYPRSSLDHARQKTFADLETTIPTLVDLIVHHRPRALRGRSLREALQIEDRSPRALEKMIAAWLRAPRQMLKEPPTLVLAALGQGRLSRLVTPERETKLLSALLTGWALMRNMDVWAQCST